MLPPPPRSTLFPYTTLFRSSANKLDDYEEGTWTPVYSDAGTGGNTAVANGGKRALYTKVGNLVTINASCRSEEHTSELQSRLHLVWRLLLEKKKKTRSYLYSYLNKEYQITIILTIIVMCTIQIRLQPISYKLYTIYL